MTNYKEIIRLHSLGLNKTRIAESCAAPGAPSSRHCTRLKKTASRGMR